ncbi:protein of unknown function DUF75 [Methanococcus vannielii SB]|jgi:uncharacterized protein (TIGR00162 family)|uniref:Proteasome assembly chaperone family protein n=1 Tax=Methanococcus vannielii (strain ATCC 35089 / DSM 1224 / JCM 13029 / OCM 148 / SB) TaxID=406327 RepID=A6UQQ3_METVS|nr:proteasome assembly chaperone family protein [Methanococcus vannielii]ABR54825.1 protein of unknown function DUF75 [Methanococcus vannielii SB]
MVKIIENVVKDAEPLTDAVLIEGLPGIGHVGRVAAEHIIEEFNGEKILEIYCDDFPPQILVNDDGTIEYMKNEFYLVKEPVPMVIVLGNTQALSPEGQYALSERLIDIGIKYGAKKTYTLGGFGIGKIVEQLKVYVASTSKEISEKHKEFGAEFRTDGGSIIGAAGLMLKFSKLKGIEGICLMGETPGYLVDPKSAANVLEMLSKSIGFEIDMKKLDERAKEMEKFLEKVQKYEEGMQPGSQSTEDLSYIG